MRASHSLEEWIEMTRREKQVVKIIVGGKEKGLVALASDKFFNT